MKMMKINDFILEESPWPERYKDDAIVHEILSILDDVTMDPMERALMKSRLGEKLRGGKTLPYCAGLVKEYIEFYEDCTDPFVIELIGMSNYGLDVVAKAFLEFLSNSFVRKLYLDFKSLTQCGYKMAIVGISRKAGVEEELLPIIEKRLRLLEERSATLIMEYAGREQRDDDLFNLFIVYDRQHRHHGYVALKV